MLIFAAFGACSGKAVVDNSSGAGGANGAGGGAATTSSSAASSAAGTGGGSCAGSATTEECVQCCRLPDAPNYGGFELYEYDKCNACPSCKNVSPCGTNVTPAAGKACVACLQMKLAAGPSPQCTGNSSCAVYAKCLKTCPIK